MSETMKVKCFFLSSQFAMTLATMVSISKCEYDECTPSNRMKSNASHSKYAFAKFMHGINK